MTRFAVLLLLVGCWSSPGVVAVVEIAPDGSSCRSHHIKYRTDEMAQKNIKHVRKTGKKGGIPGTTSLGDVDEIVAAWSKLKAKRDDLISRCCTSQRGKLIGWSACKEGALSIHCPQCLFGGGAW
jgi:hypothetical protein